MCVGGGAERSIIIENISPAHVSNLFHFEFEEIYLIAVEFAIDRGVVVVGIVSYRHSRDRYG